MNWSYSYKAGTVFAMYQMIISKGKSWAGTCNKLYNLTRYPKEWTIDLELIRVYLQNLSVHIENMDIMRHIISNLSEVYNNIVKTLEDKLHDDNDPLSIETIHCNISTK